MAQHLPPGTVLDGRYRIDAALGQGGFGITYAAENVRLGLKVAVKELFWRDHSARAEGSQAVALPRAADVDVFEDRIGIVLTDKGPGIPDIDLAMQEGYSTATDRVRSLGFGAGMGLPNMKRYTDEMRIDSTVGKGTVITMSILVNNR